MREHTKVTEFTPKAREAGDGSPVEERIMADAFDAVTLFDADGVDASQYTDTVQRKTPLEPEKHLLLAILEDALSCYRKNVFARTAKKQAAFREAEEWILDTDDERFPQLRVGLRGAGNRAQLPAPGPRGVEAAEGQGARRRVCRSSLACRDRPAVRCTRGRV